VITRLQAQDVPVTRRRTRCAEPPPTRPRR
jgi:hypothetical protein